MNPYKRGALMLIRLIAFGFVVFGTMNLGLLWFKISRGQVEAERLVLLWRFFYLSLPLIIGLALWIKSPAIANRLTQDFDD